MKKTLIASIIMGACALSATNALAAIAANVPTTGNFSDPTVQDWASGQVMLYQEAQDQITANKLEAENANSAQQTTLDNHGSELNTLEGHLQSVDDLAHYLHSNNLQDRQELADHDAAITKNASDIQYNQDQIVVSAQNIDKNQRSIVANQTNISANSANIGLNTKSIDDNQNNIATNKAAIATNVASIALNTQDIHANQQDITQNKAGIKANQSSITGLKTDVQQAKTSSINAQSRAETAFSNAEANHQALQATNHRVADDHASLANHEQRIEKLEANNSANFGKLKNEVNDNRQRASAAISGVAAMANIPQVIQGQTFSVGAGVGTTDSESALAVGFSARATEHVVVKASVSDDTQQNFVVGGGVSYGW